MQGKFIFACISQDTEMDKAIIEAQKMSETGIGFYHVIKKDNEFIPVHEYFLNKNPKFKSLALIR